MRHDGNRRGKDDAAGELLRRRRGEPALKPPRPRAGSGQRAAELPSGIGVMGCGLHRREKVFRRQRANRHPWGWRWWLGCFTAGIPCPVLRRCQRGWNRGSLRQPRPASVIMAVVAVVVADEDGQRPPAGLASMVLLAQAVVVLPNDGGRHHGGRRHNVTDTRPGHKPPRRPSSILRVSFCTAGNHQRVWCLRWRNLRGSRGHTAGGSVSIGLSGRGARR